MGIYLRTEALQEGVKKRETVLKQKDMVSLDLIVHLYSVLLTIFSGDAVFFHSNVLHSSGPNLSSKRRMAINISYNAANNQPSEIDICPPYTKIHKVNLENKLF